MNHTTMTTDEFRAALETGVVRFKFRKADGTVREMLGTTDPTRFSYSFKGEVSDRVDTAVTPVYDLEKKAWRSLRNDSLIDWSVE
jgi:hypothetical protein